MNKKGQYFILCEDKQTQCFMWYFLVAHHINSRKIRCLPLPLSGCGEQYVRENYPKELKKIRSKNFNNIILFVCLDADVYTVSDREQELDAECKRQNILCRSDTEPVAFFVPKRNIETWIQWLADKSAINEIDEYPHKRRKEAECKPQAEKLADMFIQNTDLSFALPSVQSAKKEYDRL